ncbi:mCG1026516 [Mus musculus]|nr:mCG1026516 [Mus musculus]
MCLHSMKLGINSSFSDLFSIFSRAELSSSSFFTSLYVSYFLI